MPHSLTLVGLGHGSKLMRRLLDMSDYDYFDELCVNLSGLRGAVESGDALKIAMATSECKTTFTFLLEEIKGRHPVYE
jgi:hypothetical protein